MERKMATKTNTSSGCREGERKKRVEDISIALVREYLSRKGYKSTLLTLDTEAPRSEDSISNRSVLAKEMGVANLMKANKEQSDCSYRTILEVIVNHQIQSFSQAMPTSKPITDVNPITCSTTLTTPTKITAPTSSTSAVEKRKVTGGSSRQEVVTNSCSVRETDRNHKNDDELILYEDIEEDSSYSLTRNDIMLTSSVDPYSVSDTGSNGETISFETAVGLREIVFGSAATHSFNSEWRNQGFVFNKEIPSLSYGLVQYKGGPCGVLACIQAYIIKNVLFADGDDGHDKANGAMPIITTAKQRELLARSLADVLWKVGERQRAKVTLKSWRPLKSLTLKTKSYLPDQLTELLVIHSFTDYDELYLFLHRHIDLFCSAEDDNDGCILLLYSVILTRGIQRLRSDFDDPPNTKLIGAHGYCSQEIINLFLTGSGTSNAFNGDIVIDEGTEVSQRLRGLDEQSEIGYLTLFEYYGSCKVGDYYKSPTYPVWVLCSESHFTVIFSLNKDIVDGKRSADVNQFDIHYYDTLGQFNEPVTLNISKLDLLKPIVMTSLNSEPMLSPIELTLLTKWKGIIGWSCDRIL